MSYLYGQNKPDFLEVVFVDHPLVALACLGIGIVIGYVGTYIVTFISIADELAPGLTTKDYIAADFDRALPYILWIFALILFVGALYWWMSTVDKNRQQILDNTNEDANKIITTAREEATSIKRTADQAAAKTTQTAETSASSILYLAKEHQRQVEIKEQELEIEYQSKKQSYLEELDGLKSGRVRDKEIIEVQEEIIRWQQEGNTGAAKRAKDRLRGLRKRKRAVA